MSEHNFMGPHYSPLNIKLLNIKYKELTWCENNEKKINNEFEPRLNSAKNRFQLIAGLIRKIAQKFCEWKPNVSSKQFILFTEP